MKQYEEDFLNGIQLMEKLNVVCDCEFEYDVSESYKGL